MEKIIKILKENQEIAKYGTDGEYETYNAVYSDEYENVAKKIIELSSSSPSSIQRQPKIVQILIAPENEKWQGIMFGLGNDGIVYYRNNENKWIMDMTLPEINLPIECAGISDHDK